LFSVSLTVSRNPCKEDDNKKTMKEQRELTASFEVLARVSVTKDLFATAAAGEERMEFNEAAERTAKAVAAVAVRRGRRVGTPLVRRAALVAVSMLTLQHAVKSCKAKERERERETY
jgi:hypothetical protein